MPNQNRKLRTNSPKLTPIVEHEISMGLWKNTTQGNWADLSKHSPSWRHNKRLDLRKLHGLGSFLTFNCFTQTVSSS